MRVLAENGEYKDVPDTVWSQFDTKNSYVRLKRNIIDDIYQTRHFREFLYERFPRKDIQRMLKHPKRHIREIRALSRYLYVVSTHYRRLVDYFSGILTYSYTLKRLDMSRNVKVGKARDSFKKIATLTGKYNMRYEAAKMMRIAIRDGISVGIMEESTNSFYILPLEPQYVRIFAVEDGCPLPSIDLSFFNSNSIEILNYGVDIQAAYTRYKNRLKNGKRITREDRFYELKDGICVLADDTDICHWLPMFTGLLLDILDIFDAKGLQRTKDEQSNYKAISAQIPTNDNGVPTMEMNEVSKYFNQMAGELPDGIGLLMSPFSIDDHNFQDNTSAQRDAAIAASDNFWQSAGMSPALMGGGNISAAGSMLMAVKPDEMISYKLLQQFEMFINRRLKNMNFAVPYRVAFTPQSIFNTDEYANRYQKAASYGVPVKMEYASSLGLTPLDVIGNAETEEMFSLSDKSWAHPLKSSNQSSNDDSIGNEEGGRPSNEETGVVDSPSTEEDKAVGQDE